MSLHSTVFIRRALVVALLSFTSGVSSVWAADAAAQAAAQAPAPRDANGKIIISNEPGKPIGLWVTDYSTRVPMFNYDQVKFKPWAKGLFDARQKHDLEPHARCKPSGGVRQFLTPYGVEILEMADLKQIYIFDLGGPHTWRTIYMDGRGHPEKWEPTYYGHSIGHWDGDTLVVETTGYNTGFWFERAGLPHTESVKTTEYFTRRSQGVMDYRFVMEDPTVYEAPVEGNLKMNFRQEELFEYQCQQSNYAPELMVDETNRAVGRSSPITP